MPKGSVQTPAIEDPQTWAISGCLLCGHEAHAAWCSVPSKARATKRRRWRLNKAARRRELAHLIQEQAAEMKRGAWINRQRLGPQRLRTASLTEIMYSDGEGVFEDFPYRIGEDMIAYA